ncbi:unnamed protein product [Parnassius apollo]|uniref:(apollo) hypothetical protein n=1 Tax=Parnassius apollo TaxID=110799 RepID=A0A8S3WTJ4_PARAO|nr:unnamed protein product [Parnassius apollo]
MEEQSVDEVTLLNSQKRVRTSSSSSDSSDSSENSVCSQTKRRKKRKMGQTAPFVVEMAENSSFVAKPARGWLHPDSILASDGITYAVRYIGCMEVLTSMKKLDFDTRSQVAKECIARVCAAAGLRSADKKRRISQAAACALAAKPRMSHSGSNVALTISSKAITIAALEGGDTIARHDMPRVSFASGGDSDSLDFVAYVAKAAPPTEWRACYVLECGGMLAQDVIATIGQAFELRFKEFLTKPSSLNLNGSRPLCSGDAPTSTAAMDDREYYNDLPDKIPPDPTPTYRHPPPPPLASLAPISSCEESVRHYVNQTPPPRTPPTALLPNHHTDIFDMLYITLNGYCSDIMSDLQGAVTLSELGRREEGRRLVAA